MTEEDRIYTVSAAPPTVEYGKTYVRIPYDIREETPTEDTQPPEGMTIYSYNELKLTYPAYTATLATKEEMQIADAETWVSLYETLRSE